MMCKLPFGSKDANNRGLGPRYDNVTVNGIWDLKPCYLGPWTIGVMVWVYHVYYESWCLFMSIVSAECGPAFRVVFPFFAELRFDAFIYSVCI